MATNATAIVMIANKLGLHARPATEFVELAMQYPCTVHVRRVDAGPDGDFVDGKSIMQMMMLGATRGTELEIAADGDQADEAVDALVALIDSRFSEE